MYKRALRALRNITTIDHKEFIEARKEEKEGFFEVKTSTPMKVFLKRDLTLISREMQVLILFVMPLMIPIVFAIGGFGGDYVGVKGLTEGFLFMMFYASLMTIMLIMGLTNIESGGETITSSLPIIVRDQMKAKLPYFFINVQFFVLVTIPFFIGHESFQSELIMILIFLPIISIVGLSTFFFKILMFGKLKYKFVIEEIKNQHKMLKYIAVVIFPFILMGGFIALTQTKLYIVGISVIVAAVILYLIYNRMFPKLKSKPTLTTPAH